jgi:hypothetical protein
MDMAYTTTVPIDIQRTLTLLAAMAVAVESYAVTLNPLV